MKIRLFQFLAACLAAGSLLFQPFSFVEAAGTTYYVSNAGSDQNTGRSVDQAFATIARVNQLNLGPGDRILFRCGDTWRTEIIEIKGSGTADAPLRIGSYPDPCSEKPVLSGAYPVSGWQALGGQLYAAELHTGLNAGHFASGVNQLFRGPARLPFGRWPNLDAADGGYARIDSQTDSTRFVDTQLPEGDWQGAVAHIRGMRWYILNRSVTADSGSTLTVGHSLDCWQNNCENWGYFLNNHFLTLDQEGEWFYDSQSGILYLYTYQGLPDDGEIEASVILRDDDRSWGGITIGEDLNAPGPAYLIVENLVVERWFRHGIALPTNFAHFEPHHLTIRNNEIRDVDGIGINLGTWVWGAQDGRPDGWRGGYQVEVHGNQIERANQMGINTYSRDSIFSNNEIRDIGLIANLGTAGLGCRLTDTGGRCTEDGDGVRIKVDKAADSGNNNLWRGNTLERIGYNGFDVFGYHNTFEKNIIREACFTKGDCGGVRTFGGTNLADTPVYDLHFEQNMVLSVIGNTDGCADQYDELFGFGFYIDHYSRDVVLQNNTISAASAHGILYQNSTGRIKNNHVYHNSLTYPYGSQIYLSASPTHIQEMTGNIFFSSKQDSRTLSVPDADQIGLADANAYFNPYQERSINVAGQRMTLAEWQAYSGMETSSVASWYHLAEGEAPFSILFINPKDQPLTINLGANLYRDVFQNAFFGELILPGYSSRILIEDGPAPLTLQSLWPGMLEQGSDGIILALQGSGFTPQSEVRWMGTARPTTFLNEANLEAQIDAADLAIPGVYHVTVFDPNAGQSGGETQPLQVIVVTELFEVFLPMVTCFED